MEKDLVTNSNAMSSDSGDAPFINNNFTEQGVAEAERLQKAMRRYAETVMAVNKKVSYQDCVTGFILWKIGELTALLNSDKNVQGSVATEVDSSTNAGNKAPKSTNGGEKKEE